MKKLIFGLASLLLTAGTGNAKTTIPFQTGVWEGQYSGFDPNTASDVIIRRKLILEPNFDYTDTLWGRPTSGEQDEEIVFETEFGTWTVNADEDSVIWTPIESWRIDISSHGELVQYDRGVHRSLIDLYNEDKMWQFHDYNLDVDYLLQLVEEISKPATPLGETSPVVSETYTYSTNTATNNYSHIVEYSFDWGDETSSSWSTDTTAEHSWESTGTKIISVTARSQYDTSITKASDDFTVNVVLISAVIDRNFDSSPGSTGLLSGYPNPFTDKTLIRYYLSETSEINLAIYNTNGQLVKNLVNQVQPSGKYELIWDGSDNNGNMVAGGIYFIHLVSGLDFDSQRIVFLE